MAAVDIDEKNSPTPAPVTTMPGTSHPKPLRVWRNERAKIPMVRQAAPEEAVTRAPSRPYSEPATRDATAKVIIIGSRPAPAATADQPRSRTMNWGRYSRMLKNTAESSSTAMQAGAKVGLPITSGGSSALAPALRSTQANASRPSGETARSAMTLALLHPAVLEKSSASSRATSPTVSAATPG